MHIKGKTVILRAIEDYDLIHLQKWANDPATQDGIGEIYFPSSMDFHKSWHQNLYSDTLNRRFVVEVPDVGIIGLSSITKIDWRNRHAWHGLVLGESSFRNKGYGIDAIMATMRYAFDEMNRERLDGSMIEYNNLSLSTYCGKRLGWKLEGRRRNYYYRKGRYWDQILVGITKQDYLSIIQKTHYWELS
jgi:RimJ/RimL family protein N-acetyltransferase